MTILPAIPTMGVWWCGVVWGGVLYIRPLTPRPLLLKPTHHARCEPASAPTRAHPHTRLHRLGGGGGLRLPRGGGGGARSSLSIYGHARAGVLRIRPSGDGDAGHCRTGSASSGPLGAVYTGGALGRPGRCMVPYVVTKESADTPSIFKVISWLQPNPTDNTGKLDDQLQWKFNLLSPDISKKAELSKLNLQTAASTDV